MSTNPLLLFFLKYFITIILKKKTPHVLIVIKIKYKKTNTCKCGCSNTSTVIAKKKTSRTPIF